MEPTARDWELVAEQVRQALERIAAERSEAGPPPSTFPRRTAKEGGMGNPSHEKVLSVIRSGKAWAHLQ